MDQSTDQSNLQSSKTPSAQALFQLKKEILAEWEKNVREKVNAAAQLQRPVLTDTVPSFLDNLAESLSEEHPRTIATESTTIAEEHGSERARLSRYGPDQLITEYQLLRDVVLNKLQAVVSLTEGDRITIQKSFDQAVCDAMTAFFLVHSQIREKFVAGLGHDLRNPLGAAKMSAELILLSLNDEAYQGEIFEDLRKLAQRIVNNAKRADRMIQDMLDASVIQIGEKVPLKVGEWEILAIVKDVITDLNRKEQERIHLVGSPVWGHWDGEALRRSVENLLSNAMKYGDSETPVTIRVNALAGRMILSVHNLGAEIPAEEQEVLFQAFRRSQAAKASGKKGWGIGLALVRGVAEGHGGSIAVDSLRGRGTTFSIDIPVDARPFLDAPTTTS